ncbi:MAG: hypothetical protein QW692_06005 [Nitrososphaerota archaeon]
MVRLRKVAEIAELSSPEECAKIAEEAMRMMGSDDELERLEAQGMLDSSKCVARVWEFYWPPKVYVTRIFDDLRAAESVAEAHRSLGIKVWKVFRRLDDRVLPAVKMEWEAYYLLGEFFREAFDVEWSRLDRKMNAIVQRYLTARSRRRALRMLAREAGRMGAELMKGE